MIPKHVQACTEIKDAIQKGSYNANEMLPSGEESAKQYAYNALTVKKALDRLVSEGVIARKRGLGSFVKKRRTGPDRMQGVPVIGRDLIREEVISVAEKLEIVACTTELADKMNIQAGEFVYGIECIRLYKQEPRVVEYIRVPLQIISGFQRRDVETSIYVYIGKQLHKHIRGTHLSFQIVRPQALEKKYLHMSDNDFVCQAEELAYLDIPEIFEYSVARYPPQYFHFETNVIKELYDN